MLDHRMLVFVGDVWQLDLPVAAFKRNTDRSGKSVQATKDVLAAIGLRAQRLERWRHAGGPRPFLLHYKMAGPGDLSSLLWQLPGRGRD